ncbi:MAG: ABC transporter permease [Chloroflexi bacterium]|nr:ABC transporter permease [Chloroflexota bacterium]
MGRYILRRLMLTIPVLILVSIGVFSLIHLAPGNAVTAILGEERADPQVIAVLTERLGLDQPPPVQYAIWARNILEGDLGYSYHLRMPVARAIGERLPVTLQLTAVSVLLSLLIAIPLGMLSATHRGSWLDLLSGALAALGSSMPAFWLGVLMILVLAVYLKWLPPSGFVPFAQDPWGWAKSLLMPSITLGVGYTAVLSRLVRASLLDVLSEDYVRTAHAKGLHQRVVIWRHALGNALLPVITVVGLETGRLLGGAVVTETIFALPGVGRLAVDAVVGRDLVTAQAVTLLMAGALLLSNLVADVLYGVADPRIRYD